MSTGLIASFNVPGTVNPLTYPFQKLVRSKLEEFPFLICSTLVYQELVSRYKGERNENVSEQNWLKGMQTVHFEFHRDCNPLSYPFQKFEVFTFLTTYLPYGVISIGLP